MLSQTRDSRFLVLQLNIACKDDTVGHALWHVWMPGTVIKDQASHELGLHTELVLHDLNLHHVQVEFNTLALNCQNTIHNNICEYIGKLLVNLRSCM